MAQTVTLKNYNHAKTFVTASGNTTARHELTFTNSSGKEITRYIWKGSPLYTQLMENPLATGQQVDVGQVQNGKYWEISTIGAPGSLVPQEYANTTAIPVTKSNTTQSRPVNNTNYQKNTAYAVNPDKDISMELGGLMHDAATLVAAGKGDDVEAVCRSLFLAKRRINDAVKDGSIFKAKTTSTESSHVQYQVVDANDDSEPFPY